MNNNFYSSQSELFEALKKIDKQIATRNPLINPNNIGIDGEIFVVQNKNENGASANNRFWNKAIKVVIPNIIKNKCSIFHSENLYFIKNFRINQLLFL